MPQVSASYDVQNFLKKPSFGGFSLNSTWERTLGLTVTQNLYSFGAVSNAIDAAKTALDISKLTESLTTREVVYSVKLGYYSIQLAKRQLNIAEESLKNAKNNLTILRNSFASGRPPQQDHIRLRTDVASRFSQVQSARQRLDQALSSFRILLGLSETTKVDIEGNPQEEFGQMSEAILKDDLLKRQPQLRFFDKQISYSESLAKAEESKLYPRLGLFYSFSLSERSNQGIFQYDTQIDTSVVGLSLSWDLWKGGTNRADIEKAHAFKYGAELRKKQEKDKIQQALEGKYIEYNSLIPILQNDKESVKLAKESFRVSQNRFRTGKTSVTELNSSEAQLYQAMLNKALHEFQLSESRAAIKKIISEKDES